MFLGLLTASLFVPLATAAPTVLPTTSSAYAIHPTNDYVWLVPLQNPAECGGISVAGVNDYQYTAPNGEALVFVNTVTVCDTGPGVVHNPVCAGVTLQGGGYQRYSLDGVLLEPVGQTQAFAASGGLVGDPGDGTFSSENPRGQINSGLHLACIHVGGKEYLSGAGACAFQNFWNWRSSGTNYAPSGSPCPTTAENDPNNFVFFSDQAPTDPDPQGFTTQSTVSCTAPMPATLNGLWIRGSQQSLNTFATFYHVQGIPIGPDADLRDNVGVASTGYVDKGSGAQGTHSAIIGYNNAAGNSYQLSVKNGTSGEEQLGAVLFVPLNQCNPPNIGSSLLQITSIGLDLSVSQAQCRGDPVSFSVDVDLTTLLTLGDLEVVVYDAFNDDIVLTVDESQMFNRNSGQVQFFNRTFPPGPYVAHALADIVGIGAVDLYDSEAFNVPQGTCIDTPFDDSSLRQFTISRTNQTNSFVNSTSNTTQNLVVEVHQHIDTHFNQTWTMIQDFELNITTILNDLCVNGNCNFTVNNTQVLEELEAQQLQFLELDPDESWTFLLFLAILLLSYWQRWLFVAIACLIGITDMWLNTPILGFKGTALVMVAGIALQILVDMRDARLEKQQAERDREAQDE